MTLRLDRLDAVQPHDIATVRIGVLALQGAVSEHVRAIRAVGASPVEVLTVEDLRGVDGLILPGGESTTVGKLLARFELLDPLRDRILAGMPIYGTCTGMILMAREVTGGLEGQPTLATMDIAVERNAFGRQRESFEATVELTLPERETFHAVFIRAPRVRRVGPEVTVVARYQDEIVGVQQGTMLATAFHPELTGDGRLHAHFVRMCARSTP